MDFPTEAQFRDWLDNFDKTTIVGFARSACSCPLAACLNDLFNVDGTAYVLPDENARVSDGIGNVIGDDDRSYKKRSASPAIERSFTLPQSFHPSHFYGREVVDHAHRHRGGSSLFCPAV
jgi:hypothetical protein